MTITNAERIAEILSRTRPPPLFNIVWAYEQAQADIGWLLVQLRAATDWERLAKAAWNAIDDDRLSAQENVDAIAAALKAAVEKGA